MEITYRNYLEETVLLSTDHELHDNIILALFWNLVFCPYDDKKILLPVIGKGSHEDIS